MNHNSFSEFKNNLWTAIISCPIIYIHHFHFQYIDEALNEVLKANRIPVDCIMEFSYGLSSIISFESKTKDTKTKQFRCANDLLDNIVDHPEELQSDIFSEKSIQKNIFLFKGLKGLDAENKDVDNRTLSLLQLFATQYERDHYDKLTTIIIVSPEDVTQIPSSLRKFITVLEIAPPTAEEIKQYIINQTGIKFNDRKSARTLNNLVRTLQGLQMYEVKQTLKTVLAKNNGITDRAIGFALKEKKNIVKKSGIIEVIDTNVKFEDIGGLKKLREDLEIKSTIFNNLVDASTYNIPIPKGILIIGMPGCGKTMIAKATANKFGVSLLKLDVGRLMGKYVGESENNMRLALATAEAAHPCVLWIDEIEKAFAGGSGASNDNDMLVMRMMGHFLTWMQERDKPVYIVATANDVMRPEFMRKGRFDDVYFVDFPNNSERAQILKVIINKRYPANGSNNLFDFSDLGDCKEVVENMKGEYGGFSGSEIECVLNMVVEKKFTEYIREKESNNNINFSPSIIKITKNDFRSAIDHLQKSVMANNKSKEMKDGNKTPIERIREMQEIYNFTNASGESVSPPNLQRRKEQD